MTGDPLTMSVEAVDGDEDVLVRALARLLVAAFLEHEERSRQGEVAA